VRPYAPPAYVPPVYVPPANPFTPRAYTPLNDLYEPQSGSTYDWRSGNTYRWRKEIDGDTVVNGSNLNTGSMWRSTIKPDGWQHGTDKQGNVWRYNAQTGGYWRSDGTVCTGTGASRVCTGGKP
jgi:hypothetical protein